ncbi:PREDICTED: putative UDP-GlcNAc:betaGal beta-1,3-N-acetylglucosaminyltransferase LOC100288842 [Nanorana parkeri]|uniref:putative UDP-GlcNAc:betaGal beta-1,3-N-acetylglucosaminyltransferase LOC100288842 n=1 Tax=Nanorana parkeri TaxID=125878 RepID=UPI0008546FEF|nr:PREDICTED: putative UDP-GlcNAc:betaGal beta-1,3-N-acetylglucosaminyltransferase LOC100288842 [Nanorana parkeri]
MRSRSTLMVSIQDYKNARSVFQKEAVAENSSSMNHIETREGKILLVNWRHTEGWMNNVLVEVKGRNYWRQESSPLPQQHLVCRTTKHSLQDKAISSDTHLAEVMATRNTTLWSIRVKIPNASLRTIMLENCIRRDEALAAMKRRNKLKKRKTPAQCSSSVSESPSTLCSKAKLALAWISKLVLELAKSFLSIVWKVLTMDASLSGWRVVLGPLTCEVTEPGFIWTQQWLTSPMRKVPEVAQLNKKQTWFWLGQNLTFQLCLPYTSQMWYVLFTFTSQLQPLFVSLTPCLSFLKASRKVALCRLRTHQWCFILFNIALFHALLFGTEFMEEYFLQAVPFSYSDEKFVEIRERARMLDMHLLKDNISRSYAVSGSEVCSRQEVYLLLVIYSSPENKTRRERIRNTWGNTTSVQGYVVTRVFMFGRADSEIVQSDIFNESQVHQDIVQGGFLETYTKETTKTIMMMEWIVTFCPNARFILKADQEMFVNVRSLAGYLLNLESRMDDIYIGRVIYHSVPDRDPQSPNFVPISAYSQTYYPDFCSGSAMAISQDVLRKMYLISGKVNALLPSEVFIGICAQWAGVTPIQSSRFSGSKHIRYNRCCYQVIFSSSNLDDMELSTVWKDLKDSNECSKLETYYGLVSCKVWSYLDQFKYFSRSKTGNGGGIFR